MSRDRVEIIRERWTVRSDSGPVAINACKDIQTLLAEVDGQSEEIDLLADTNNWQADKITELQAEVDRLRGVMECALDHCDSELPEIAAEGMRRCLYD